MTIARRRHVLRPSASASSATSARVSRWREQLADEQQALNRWMAKLKRAFHSLEKTSTTHRPIGAADSSTRGGLMSRIIEVTVSPKGETTIQTKGFAGEQCRDATRTLEAALGVKTDERLTSEFHASTTTTQAARQ